MINFKYLRDQAWRRRMLTDGFGPSFRWFLAAAIIAGTACYFVRGRDVYQNVLSQDLELLTGLLARIVLTLSIAALIWGLLPRERISALVGQQTGVLGLVIAAGAGAVTPGGSASAFALMIILIGSGVDRGVLVTYISAWAILGLQRFLVWEIPIMGFDFAFFRLFLSLPLPIIAGVIARQLTFQLRFNSESQNNDVQP